MIKSAIKTIPKESFTPGFALLGYMLFIVFLITLIPFQFQVPERFEIHWYFYWSGLITNLIMFLPLGFLYRLSRRIIVDIICFKELIFGFLFSVSVEIIQGFIPGRVTSGYDVLANCLGAWAGALMFEFMRRRVKRIKLSGLFALQLPLMSLIYLLIPLIWLNLLSRHRPGIRMVLLCILGLAGYLLLLSIFRYRFKPAGRFSFITFIPVVLGWFYIAAVPGMLIKPLKILFLGLILLIVSTALGSLTKRGVEARRYEVSTLKKILPPFSIYLLYIFFWPTALDLTAIQNFYAESYDFRLIIIIRFLEQVAALTLLGYIIAELRGRRQETIYLVIIIVLGVSLAGSLVAGFMGSNGFNIWAVLIFTLAPLSGTVLYRMQLTAVRKILADR